MSSNKISLIVMQDEGRTHRLRIGPKAFSLIIGILMIVPILFVLSLWANIYLYKERSEIAQSRVELQYTVDRNSQTIARLTNLESFLGSHSPGLLGLLVSQVNIDATLIPMIGSSDEKLAKALKKLAMSNPINLKGELGKNIASRNDKNKGGKIKKTPPLVTIAIAPKAGLGKKEVDLDPKNLTQEVKQGEMTENNMEERVDLGYVKIQYVQAHLMGDIISIQYYLRNTGKDVPLSGNQRYTLLEMKDGKSVGTALPMVTNATFRIRSMKIVESVISLPKIEIAEGAFIQIDVVRNGIVLFRRVYPLMR